MFQDIGVQLKKKKKVQNGIGLLPNCIVKKKKMYCNLAIVLQERGLESFLLQLYCKRRATVLQYGVDSSGIVLQYLYCIAT